MHDIFKNSREMHITFNLKMPTIMWTLLLLFVSDAVLGLAKHIRVES